MTPRDSESVLDRMDKLEKARNERIDFDDMESIRRVTDARRDFDQLMTEHERTLLDVARAAQPALELLAAEGYDRHHEGGFPVCAEYENLRGSLLALTTPSEQNLQTESESRGVAPPYKGVEERSA